VTRSRSRRSVTKSDREVTYGVLFVTGIALLLVVLLWLYAKWSRP
jgi:hypothetical protein